MCLVSTLGTPACKLIINKVNSCLWQPKHSRLSQCSVDVVIRHPSSSLQNVCISLKKVIKLPLSTWEKYGKSFHKCKLCYSSSPPPKIQLTRGKRWRVFNKFFTLNCLEMYIRPLFSNRKKLSRHDSTHFPTSSTVLQSIS